MATEYHRTPAGDLVRCWRDGPGGCPLCPLLGPPGTLTEQPVTHPTPIGLGDVVAALAHRIGADRLAAWWERRTGRPCGCAARQEALNRAGGHLVRWSRDGPT